MSAKYQRDLDRRKHTLRQLAGEHGHEAFNRVRLIYQADPSRSWVDAYDVVIREIRDEQARARKTNTKEQGK